MEECCTCCCQMCSQADCGECNPVQILACHYLCQQCDCDCGAAPAKKYKQLGTDVAAPEKVEMTRAATLKF